MGGLRKVHTWLRRDSRRMCRCKLGARGLKEEYIIDVGVAAIFGGVRSKINGDRWRQKYR